MYKKSLNLPFTNIKGGNKKSFKIMDEKSIKNGKGIINFIKDAIHSKNISTVNYIKASDSKKI